ncbi:cytochrome P450 20A1 isoform X1 [Sminthopsis crassicaudata]|uniref:cytochrome P450 20A1 isoform X1 n=2 Tax=Sminthopsis crassicaudata TaxID=9301 RepID=UPI003D6983AF
MLDFAIFAVTFLLVLVGAVLYLYPASRQASGIPGITPTEEKDGNLPDIVNSGSLHEFLVNLHERYGPVVSFWFGRRLVVSLGTINALKQHINPNRTSHPFETMLKPLLMYQSGLSGDAVENHIRKKLYENGVNKSLQSNFAVMVKLSEELLRKWLSYPESQHVPLYQHMLGYAMKAVTQMALGNSFEDDQEVIRFQKNHNTVWSEIGKGFLDGSIDKSTTRKKQYEEALMEIESVFKKVIKERRGRNFSQHIFIDSLLQGNLNDKQILEDSMIFSLAGCVITANLCMWSVYFLTTSEDVQKKLHKELDQVLGKGAVTQEKIDQLRYCRQVLCETVRTAKLTPIAARLQDLEGKVDQHIIPRETLVLYALGVVLQDRCAWPSPYKFDPDRFDDESAMKNLSLLGFSGTQECPELRFAYMVATVLLSVLVRKLYLHPVEGQVIETKYELVTSSKEEAWVTVSKRN